MKLLVVFALALAAVSADVSELSNKNAEVLEQRQDISPDGGEYYYVFKTSNGIEENVEAKTITVNNSPAQEVQGSVSYPDSTGQRTGWTWTAGVDGYKAVGEVIPTPPPTPDLILRLINYLAENARTAAPRASVSVQ